ncbi:MAG: molybdopterin-dependent oxidoreductase [Chloroflexi bacterium]|nr:molybdopterin-dependent oxidoreductase [Chloroflexota bacterium]
MASYISRRDFLKTSGATLAGALIIPRIDFRFLTPVSQAAASIDKWIASGCNGCVGWCPLRVRVVNGKAVKIEGNPESKWTRGKLCPRGRLNLQIIYDPDRVKKPLKRTNPKKGREEDPQWMEIPERLALFRGRYTPLDADLLYGRLIKAYGSPNSISHSALCSETDKSGNWYARGEYAYTAYDLEDANYILAFGTPYLESNRPTTGLLAAAGAGRRGGGIRPKTVVVDPRQSVSAARADDWLPINPGTDGALALGMAHEILTAGLWDRKFIGDFKDPSQTFMSGRPVNEADWQDAYSIGLVKWWNEVLNGFTANVAAKETGIPEGTIKKIAREFATTKPAITLRGRGVGAWPGNGTYNVYAIYALNGLVGSVEVKGGANHYPSVSFSDEPIPITQDDLAKTGTKQPRIDEKGTVKFPYADVITNNAADNILKDFPYPIEMILSYWNNWTFSAPGSKRWEEVLKKVPFMAHHTTHISEWSMYADIILPAKTYLEKWSAGSPAGGSGVWSGMTLFQPVIEPLFDCMSEVELALALGKKLGEYYPSIKTSFDGIGGTYGDTAQGYTQVRTEKAWKPLSRGWEEFREKGTVNVGPHKFNWEFKTPSRKFEFVTGNLKKLFDDKKVSEADLDVYRIKARGDKLYMPHYQRPIFIGEAAQYPLVLITYKNQLNQEGRSANTPWAQEMYLTPLYGAGWTNLAEINPLTGAKYGIAEGDAIYVESEVGNIKAIAKLSEGVHPEVVAMCYGQGHWAYGHLAKDRGVNPNEITGVMYEHITGMSAYFNTRVKVFKA